MIIKRFFKPHAEVDNTDVITSLVPNPKSSPFSKHSTTKDSQTLKIWAKTKQHPHNENKIPARPPRPSQNLVISSRKKIYSKKYKKILFQHYISDNGETSEDFASQISPRREELAEMLGNSSFSSSHYELAKPSLLVTHLDKMPIFDKSEKLVLEISENESEFTCKVDSNTLYNQNQKSKTTASNHDKQHIPNGFTSHIQANTHIKPSSSKLQSQKANLSDYGDNDFAYLQESMDGILHKNDTFGKTFTKELNIAKHPHQTKISTKLALPSEPQVLNSETANKINFTDSIDTSNSPSPLTLQSKRQLKLKNSNVRPLFIETSIGASYITNQYRAVNGNTDGSSSLFLQSSRRSHVRASSAPKLTYRTINKDLPKLPSLDDQSPFIRTFSTSRKVTSNNSNVANVAPSSVASTTENASLGSVKLNMGFSSRSNKVSKKQNQK